MLLMTTGAVLPPMHFLRIGRGTILKVTVLAEVLRYRQSRD